VAEHSFNVAAWLHFRGHDRATQLLGLLHDAPEAYLPDIAAPIKQRVWVSHGERDIEVADWVRPPPYPDMQIERFRSAESRVLAKIIQSLAPRLQITDAMWAAVKRADAAMAVSEARIHKPSGGRTWTPAVPEEDVMGLPNKERPWRQAESEFARRFGELAEEFK
jgi:hypothetical protein